MNTLDFYCGVYSHLKSNKLPIFMLTPIRWFLRTIANYHIPRYLSKQSNNIGCIDSDIIVSFTSFPARINNVWQVVECMLRQTIRPSKIILWLSKQQFPNDKSIPSSLLNRIGDIFTIIIVDEDVKSHKKYLYACREFPTSKLLLIDDDIYYSTTFIEELLHMYEEFGTNCIACKYGSIIKYDNFDNILPYNRWASSYDYTESTNFFFGSGGGVLFKPKNLFKDLTNIELAMQLTPSADDIWLNAMVRLAELKAIKLNSGLLLPILQGSNDYALSSSNLNEGGNDRQIQAINDYYIKAIGKKVF